MTASSRLTVSVVVHNSPLGVLDRTLACLQAASTRLQAAGQVSQVAVTVVDNASAPDYRSELACLLAHRSEAGVDLRLLASDVNLGYGGGHNQVATASGDWRLILNPDVFLAPDALVRALAFMADHSRVGLVVPRAVDERGERLYLCKRYPSLWTLFLRGFAPAWLRRRFREALASYEMRDLDWSRPRFDLELVSGCCLLLRGEVWQRSGGFDPAYFLYFEDFDFALRVRRVTEVAYVPGFEIVHLGGGAARKGWRHRWWFVRSAWRFFHHHGWRWF